MDNQGRAAPRVSGKEYTGTEGNGKHQDDSGIEMACLPSLRAGRDSAAGFGYCLLHSERPEEPFADRARAFQAANFPPPEFRPSRLAAAEGPSADIERNISNISRYRTAADNPTRKILLRVSPARRSCQAWNLLTL